MTPVCSTALVLGIVNLLPASPPTTRTISGQEQHVFRVVVPPHHVVTSVLAQGDADLVTTICAPGGRRVGVHDLRESGDDAASFIATEGGEYRLIVAPLRNTTRRAIYRIRLEPFREITADDPRLIQAQQLAVEAKQLADSGTADQLETAIARLEEAQPIWRALGRKSSELLTLVDKGEAWLALNDYPAAEAAYAEARSLNLEVGDGVLEARILNGLALIAWPRGDIANAIRLLEEAVERCRAAKFRYGEAASLNNRGLVRWETGEYDLASRDYRAVIDIVRALGETRGEAFATNNLALVLEELGRPREAAAHLQRAAELFHRVPDRLAEGRSLISLARVQLTLEMPRTALQTIERALGLVERTGNMLAQANGLREHGRIIEWIGERTRARRLFEQALDRYRRAGSRRGESEALHALGLSYLASGDCSNAVDLLQRGLTVRSESGLRRLAIESAFRTAIAQRQCGDLAAARVLLEGVLADAEALRARVSEKEQRTSFLSSRLQYYSAYVDVLVDLHRRAPTVGYDARAFEATERARARELTERLRELWAGMAGAGHPALLERERDLRSQINYWSWQLWQRTDRASAGAAEIELRRKIDELHAQLAQIDGQIHRADPRYEALLKSAEPVSLPQIQREVLDDETVLVVFALGDEKSYAWAVTADRVVLVDLPPRAVIEQRALAFYRLMRTAASGNAANVERGRGSAAALGRMLLSRLRSSIGKRRLLIVPDGALHYVPFGLLLHPTDRRPLVDHGEIVTVPSATLLTVVRRRLSGHTPPPRLMALLADPVFDALDARLATARRSKDGAPAEQPAGNPKRRLIRLAFGGEAAERIFRHVPHGQGLKATGLAATRALALSRELARYKILHFDTHGFQDDQRPQLSGIAMSMVDASGTERDGFVRLHDIYSMQLQADLVVLSACDTGVGRQQGAEGLTSLARGFLSAGAASVLSALWEVDDEATAALMERFYDALLGQRRLSPAAALRTAQRSIREDVRWRDPYYWAGFVLHGNW